MLLFDITQTYKSPELWIEHGTLDTHCSKLITIALYFNNTLQHLSSMSPTYSVNVDIPTLVCIYRLTVCVLMCICCMLKYIIINIYIALLQSDIMYAYYHYYIIRSTFLGLSKYQILLQCSDTVLRGRRFETTTDITMHVVQRKHF